MSFRLFIFTTICSLMFLSSKISEKQLGGRQKFEITELIGFASNRTLGSHRWNPIKRKEYVENHSFIYIHESSELTLVVDFPFKNKSKKIALKLQGPRLFQISPRLVKQTKLNILMGENAQKIDFDSNESSQEGFLTFNENGQTAITTSKKEMIHTFSQTATSAPELNTSKTKNDESAIEHPNFKIHSPLTDSIKSKKSFPVELEVRFEAPESLRDKDFNIFIKKQGETDHKMIASTSYLQHTIQIHEPGNYDIEVRTSDYLWKSNSVSFQYALDNGENNKKNKNPWKLKSPKDNSIFVSQNMNNAIDFILNTKEKNIDILKVEILQKEEIIASIKEGISFGEDFLFSTILPRGHYSWRYTYKIEENEISSIQFRFSIVEGHFGSQILKKHIKNKETKSKASSSYLVFLD